MLDSKGFMKPTFYLFIFSALPFFGFCEEMSLSQNLLDKEALSEDSLFLSKLYRAKIHQKHHELEEAKTLLLFLEGKLPPRHILLFEVYYLLGEIASQQGAAKHAASYFEKALPTQNEEKAHWYADTLYQLGFSYLIIAKQSDSLADKRASLDAAEQAFERLMKIRGEENDVLAYAEFLLNKGKLLDDKAILHKMEKWICHHPFSTEESSTQALLLRAQGASSYAIGHALFQQAIEQSSPNSQWHIQAWYLMGINELERGYSLENAIQAFKKVIEGNPQDKNPLLLPAIAQQVKAFLLSQTDEGNKEAASLLHTLLTVDTKDKDSVYYLLATLHYLEGEYAKAEEMFFHLSDHFPESKLASIALFYASLSAKKQQKSEEEMRAYLRKLLEHYPNSSIAAESYIRLYSAQEYSSGVKEAILHLENLPEKYPNSPFVIYSYYLIGLERKKHLKQDHHQAIKLFKRAEDTFNQLDGYGLIPTDRRRYFLTICHQAMLERAWSYYDIALASQETKRKIFLEYASELFEQIYAKSEVQQSIDPFWEESIFGLLQCHVQNGNDKQLEYLIDKMLEKYHSATITRGFYLSRALYEKGLMKMRKGEHLIALDCFAQSEDAAYGKILIVDQKLDLWIQQSLCYRSLDQFEISMRLLSKVINEDVVSQIRLKAMYLRAELYEIQNKQELAQRQLEALAKKGGEWAVQAKEKLNREYSVSSVCLKSE